MWVCKFRKFCNEPQNAKYGRFDGGYKIYEIYYVEHYLQKVSVRKNWLWKTQLPPPPENGVMAEGA